MHCSQCGLQGFNKRSCPKHTQQGAGGCRICGSEWLYQSSKDKTLCKDCWKSMHLIVVEYHKLQDTALEWIHKGNKNKAITYLKKAIKKRNELSEFYHDKLNSGHDYYANVFLPNLIEKINASTSPAEAQLQWDNTFSTLEDREELP